MVIISIVIVVLMKFFSGIFIVVYKILLVQLLPEIMSGRHGLVLLDSQFKVFGENVKMVLISMLLMLPQTKSKERIKEVTKLWLDLMILVKFLCFTTHVLSKIQNITKLKDILLMSLAVDFLN